MSPCKETRVVSPFTKGIVSVIPLLRELGSAGNDAKLRRFWASKCRSLLQGYFYLGYC
jgi:hypothetical protein